MPEAKPRRWTWSLVNCIPWLLMVLLMSQNLMFAPPYTLDTLLVYGILWLLGAMLITLDTVRRTVRRNARGFAGGCLRGVGVAVVAIVFAILILGLNGSLVGATIGIASGLNKCDMQELPNHDIRYVCHVASAPAYILQGPPGSPIVRLVDTLITYDGY
jgi:hypothetical protein